MAKGFFTSAETGEVARRTLTVPRCGECGLFKQGCISPKMPICGEGRKGILVVGEAPGAAEDERNRPFVEKGNAGRELRMALRTLGVDMDRDCWVTNAVICRPPENRDPSPKELEACRPNIVKAMTQLKPRVILALGRFGTQAVIEHTWRGQFGVASRWLGWQIPSIELNSWIVATYHPSFILRKLSEGGVEKRIWERHLRGAIGLEGWPWKDTPNYAKQVKIVESRGVAELLKNIAKKGVVAFDYECDRLKPDSDEAAICCCAVSDGDTAVAFPWVGEAVGAMRDLLWDPGVKKIGWNSKYEERWTAKEFGKGVRGWVWCGMQASHVLDNRPHITSLKFQAFVRCGQPLYDREVARYLDAKGGNTPNRVRDVNQQDLLLYNGLDALLTFKVGQIQRAEMQRISRKWESKKT